MPIQTAIAASVAVLLAFALTPVARRIARRLGAVDQPGGRRVHAKVTPRMGGLGVVTAHLAAIGSVWAYAAWTDSAAPGEAGPLLGFLAGGLVMAATGAIDDVRAVGAKKKLVAQIIAATIAWAAGARIETLDIPYIGNFEFGAISSYVLTVGWILAFVNAINLIDGLDGLASGIVLFAAITNTIVAFVSDNALAAVLNAALGGAVLGFLYFNFNPATIFLGDTGSLYLGYCIGAAALLTGRQKESTVVALLVPLVALGVPLTDTLFTMVRRFLEKRPIFAPDRGHIHHRLLEVGLTHRRVVLFLYGSSVLLCVAALAAAFGKDWQVGGAIAAATVVVLGGARFAGYFRSHIVSSAPEKSAEESLVGHAVRQILTETPRADFETLWNGIEEKLLREGPVVVADLTSDGGIMCQGGATAPGSGNDVEYAYSWEAGGQAHRLRFVVRASGERSERLDALLELVADHVQAAVTRTAPWLQMKPARQRVATDPQVPRPLAVTNGDSNSV